MADEFQVGDELVSLSAIAGIDMDQIAETRGFGLPRGVFQFQVKEAKFTVIDTKNGKSPVAQFDCEVLSVVDLAEGEEADPDALPGKVHTESFFLRKDSQQNMAEDVGRIKAFLTDIGATATNMQLQDAILGSVGTQFVAPIMRRADKNDPDREYVNLKRDKIKPMQESAA